MDWWKSCFQQNTVNAFHRLIEKWYKGYNGVARKYINRYAALFIQAREYTGCDTQEILLSIKRRVYQIIDFFRIVDTKKDDLFIYSISWICHFANIANVNVFSFSDKKRKRDMAEKIYHSQKSHSNIMLSESCIRSSNNWLLSWWYYNIYL